MNYYSKILEILENAVEGKNIKAHRNFWRGKSRDDFVKMRVFGKKIIELGDGAGSNLIKALRGETPFGNDVPPSVIGEIYRRMPAGMDPVSESDISFVSGWIDNGCPETEETEAFAFHEVFSPHPSLQPRSLDDQAMNRFFREFDDFFMFSVSDEVSESINAFFGGIGLWPGLGGDVVDWEAFINSSDAQAAIEHLSSAQLAIMRRHFGDPIDLENLAGAFVRFGSGDLPEDKLRPQDPFHRMDGHNMWNIWLAFASASIATSTEDAAWYQIARCVVVGLVHDSLYRDDRPFAAKLHVKRYAKGQADLEDTIIRDFESSTPQAILPQLTDISIEALTPSEPLVS